MSASCESPDGPYMSCHHHNRARRANVVRHGFFKSKSGTRRRHRCKSCGKMFSSNTGSLYNGIQSSLAAFDHVVLLRVESFNRSASARVWRRGPACLATLHVTTEGLLHLLVSIAGEAAVIQD